MNAIQQDIASLTQLLNSLGPLVIALTNLAALVWILVSTIRNGQAIKAHSADITDIKAQTNSINTALTSRNNTLTERLIAANHPEGPTP
jgi:histidinol phosphatase-like enzyme